MTVAWQINTEMMTNVSDDTNLKPWKKQIIPTILNKKRTLLNIIQYLNGPWLFSYLTTKPTLNYVQITNCLFEIMKKRQSWDPAV